MNPKDSWMPEVYLKNRNGISDDVKKINLPMTSLSSKASFVLGHLSAMFVWPWHTRTQSVKC